MEGEVFLHLRPAFYLILVFIVLNTLYLKFMKNTANSGYC